VTYKAARGPNCDWVTASWLRVMGIFGRLGDQQSGRNMLVVSHSRTGLGVLSMRSRSRHGGVGVPGSC
jgi:hypothetical protein